ncbi:hypothetical protein V6N13_071182 [Hibiscus sabdariffa]
MDKRHQKQAKINNSCCSEEVSSIEWEFINMSEQEEDLIYRMHKLVGDKWGLIAGRVPGRKAEEIERICGWPFLLRWETEEGSGRSFNPIP